MSQRKPVTLAERKADYRTALQAAEDAAAAYLDARAAGAMPCQIHDEMDRAQAELRRAKRRLEETERRLVKRREPSTSTGARR